MKVFYTDLSESEFKNMKKPELKRLQSRTGYALTDYIAQNFYGVQNTDLIIRNNKPEFQNSSLCFNISHSNNLVAVAFDKYQLGFDIELIKPRDLKQLSARYSTTFNNDEEFYEFWTNLEAEIKIQAEVKHRYTKKLTPEYMMTILSANEECFERIPTVKIPLLRLELQEV